MKFTKEFLIESLDDDDATISDEIVENSRWAILHYRVFRHEGRFYGTSYRVGATELQEESPYENDSEEIECAELFPTEKTITVYEPAPKPVKA